MRRVNGARGHTPEQTAAGFSAGTPLSPEPCRPNRVSLAWRPYRSGESRYPFYPWRPEAWLLPRPAATNPTSGPFRYRRFQRPAVMWSTHRWHLNWQVRFEGDIEGTLHPPQDRRAESVRR